MKLVYFIIATLKRVTDAAGSLAAKGYGGDAAVNRQSVMRLPDITVGDDDIKCADDEPRDDNGADDTLLLAFEAVVITDRL